ncbi:YhcU family protein [Neobacillus sp. OS1-32]|uniref:YhcU family protein n=1 Tax=Neobacillus paridis TaxID=2803862 RepID=A0ABS1TWL1_9BACI|nr:MULTISPECIES: YhcU family protein [Neobacillus]MBL4954300.1 YhcU family protein [Neobacillus paridis]WML32184.1 YhcU family protein [Neobacillus sp. OS1-32]
MKIVWASTPSQEQEICELVRYLYSNVFPQYFSDHEIKRFEKLKVLYTSQKKFEEIGTLKDAFEVMTSIQTVISILELPYLDKRYSALFNKNAATLNDFGLYFPFEFEQFETVKNINKMTLSIYSKADNELLI